MGAVARTMEVLVCLYCTHALCKPKDKDEEWLPGGMRGPGGGIRPLSPCSLPASGICPQALVELCGHRTASTSPPPGILHGPGFALVFSLDPHLVRPGGEPHGGSAPCPDENALGFRPWECPTSACLLPAPANFFAHKSDLQPPAGLLEPFPLKLFYSAA